MNKKCPNDFESASTLGFTGVLQPDSCKIVNTRITKVKIREKERESKDIKVI